MGGSQTTWTPSYEPALDGCLYLQYRYLRYAALQACSTRAPQKMRERSPTPQMGSRYNPWKILKILNGYSAIIDRLSLKWTGDTELIMLIAKFRHMHPIPKNKLIYQPIYVN